MQLKDNNNILKTEHTHKKKENGGNMYNRHPILVFLKFMAESRKSRSHVSRTSSALLPIRWIIAFFYEVLYKAFDKGITGLMAC